MFGLSDSCQSICWDKHATVIYSGLNHKHIKAYDLRAGNNALTTTSTRSVYGLSMSPNGRFLASYIDNVVHVWDIRNMDKAVAHPQLQRHVNSLSWCPTRATVLTTLQRDSPLVSTLSSDYSATKLSPSYDFIIRRCTCWIYIGRTTEQALGMEVRVPTIRSRIQRRETQRRSAATSSRRPTAVAVV